MFHDSRCRSPEAQGPERDTHIYVYLLGRHKKKRMFEPDSPSGRSVVSCPSLVRSKLPASTACLAQRGEDYMGKEKAMIPTLPRCSMLMLFMFIWVSTCA